MNATTLLRVRHPHLVCFFSALLLFLPMPAFAGAEQAPPAAAYELPEKPGEILRLDDGMRRFFEQRVHRSASLEVQLDEIVAAILGEDGLHFRYEANGLYDVRETFRRRSGNCVSYSMLVVAVAREFDITAGFNEVTVTPRWNRTGKLILRNGHINVHVADIGADYEIDLKMMESFRGAGSTSYPVDDTRAFASLYTSAGVYRLAAGDRASAIRLFERAVRTDPTHVVAWCNLGNAYLLTGKNGLARQSFEQAIALDGVSLAALNGLAQVHRRAGDIQAAEELAGKARAYRDCNPYYLYYVARNEAAAGLLEEARRHLRRAIRLKDDEPEFNDFLAEISRQMDRPRAAASSDCASGALRQEALLIVR